MTICIDHAGIYDPAPTGGAATQEFDRRLAAPRRRWLGILLAFAACFASAGAHAAASATITINKRTSTVVNSGSNLPPSSAPFIDFYSVNLAGGQSADFTFDYSVTLHDGGLAIARPEGALADSVFACLPLMVRICGPEYTGFEVAKANLDFAYRDGRVANPAIASTADAPTTLTLMTQGDSFAETVTQSGTIHVHVTNLSSLDQSDAFTVYGAAWVLGVPESSTWALMLAGLAALLCRRRPPNTPGVGVHAATER